MKRLKELLKQKKITQYRLAKDTNIPSTTINSWFTKGISSPSEEHLRKIADYLGVTTAYLRYGEDTDLSLIGTIPNRVAVMNNVPNEFPDIISDRIETYIGLPNVPKGCFAMTVTDNSMSPQINAGGMVLFTPADKYESGDVVIINNEWGESMIRRYRHKENIVLFTADNPEYPTLRPDEGYHVVAKVIEVLTRRML